VERRSITGGLRGGKVVVEERWDGSMRLRFRDRYLRYHKVPTARLRATVSPPSAAGRRGAATSELPRDSTAAAPRRPAADHPWRQPFKKKRSFLLCGKPDISTLR